MHWLMSSLTFISTGHRGLSSSRTTRTQKKVMLMERKRRGERHTMRIELWCSFVNSGTPEVPEVYGRRWWISVAVLYCMFGGNYGMSRECSDREEENEERDDITEHGFKVMMLRYWLTW